MVRDELKLNPEHRPHDGRKHFVTTAKKAGADEYAIKYKYMVGHKISDITQKVYTKREFEWLKEEIEKIRQGLVAALTPYLENSRSTIQFFAVLILSIRFTSRILRKTDSRPCP